MLKFLPLFLDIFLFIFFSGVLSLILIKIFGLRINLQSLSGARNIVFIVAGAIALCLTVTPFIQFNINLYLSDLRFILDRSVPIKTTEMQEVETKLASDGGFLVDLSHSCPSISRDALYPVPNKRTDIETVHVGMHDILKIDLDNDFQDEILVVFLCGTNAQGFFVQIFDEGQVFNLNVGTTRGSALSVRGGEISISIPGGGPMCCPTMIETRYYHYRDGKLFEHRQATLQDY